MNNFEITIQRRSGDAWPVAALQTGPQGSLPLRSESSLRIDLVELTAQGTTKEYGLVLGRALFKNQVRDGFVRARAQSPDRLCVLLHVEVDELRDLHWERLCARPSRARINYRLTPDECAKFRIEGLCAETSAR
jgi:hypothetical protein